MEFRKANFGIDGTPIYEGFTKNETWNGWECPYFTFEVAEQMIMHFSNDRNMKMFYHEFFDRFVVLFLEDEIIVETYEGIIIEVDGKPIKVYDIGFGSWCWDEKE